MNAAFRGRIRFDRLPALAAASADLARAAPPPAAPASADKLTPLVECHACHHAIPARADRVERPGGDRWPGTTSYVCPRCGASQLGSADTSVDPQTRCHACEAALDDGPACPACGMLRGWAIERCEACALAQAVCTPHLAGMCDAFTLRCARCAKITTSLCIC